MNRVKVILIKIWHGMIMILTAPIWIPLFMVTIDMYYRIHGKFPRENEEL